VSGWGKGINVLWDYAEKITILKQNNSATFNSVMTSGFTFMTQEILLLNIPDMFEQFHYHS
jgi:hypothetical protein